MQNDSSPNLNWNKVYTAMDPLLYNNLSSTKIGIIKGES